MANMIQQTHIPKKNYATEQSDKDTIYSLCNTNNIYVCNKTHY